MQKFDIVGVVETQTNEHSMIGVMCYHHFGLPAEKAILNGLAKSRGVSMYWKTTAQMKVKRIEHRPEDPDCCWIRIDLPAAQPLFVGCFYAPQNSNNVASQRAYERLEEMVQDFRDQGNVILMGDFNAHTGLVGHGGQGVNSNGTKLLHLVQECDLVFLNLPPDEPPFTYTKNQICSVIDFILVSGNLNGERLDMQDSEFLFEGGSDHKMVSASVAIPITHGSNDEGMTIPLIPCYNFLQTGKWDKAEKRWCDSPEEIIALRTTLSKKIVETCAEWKANAAALVQQGNITSEQLSDAGKQLAELLRKSAAEVLGEKRHIGAGSAKLPTGYSWWKRGVAEAVKKRRDAYKVFVANPTEDNWKEFIALRQEASRVVKNAKASEWNEKMEAISEARKSFSSKRMWNLIRGITKRDITSADPLFVRKDDGTLTSSIEDAVAAWREHFYRVANPPEHQSFDAAHKALIEAEATAIDPNDEALFLTVEDVEDGIDATPTHGGPGIDKISNVLLKYGGGHRPTPFDKKLTQAQREALKQAKRDFASILLPLFQMCIIVGDVHQDGKTALQVPIPKRAAEDDASERNNYRGITLQSCMSKLLMRVLMKKYFSLQYEKTLVHEQGGFRCNRRCAHQHFLLAESMKNAIVNRSKLYVVFVDIKKAYPSVWHAGLYHKLRKLDGDKKINSHFIKFLEKCIKDGETRIRLGYNYSDPYLSAVGLREGAVESPSLFNIFINDLVEDLHAAGCVGVTNTANLIAALFADDLALLSDNIDDMQKCLNVLNTWCSKWRLQLSMDKTQAMLVGAAHGEEVQFRIGDRVLDIVDWYRYLGVDYCYDLSWDREFDRRMNKAKAAERSLCQFYTERNVPMRVKWEVWAATVRSRLEYGCEVVVFSADQMEEIEVFQRKALRRIYGCNSRTATEAVYGDLAVTPIATRFDKYRIRLYNEVSRDGTLLSLHRAVWDAQPQGVYPLKSLKKEAKRIKTFSCQSINAHHNKPDFSCDDWWKCARKAIDESWVKKWQSNIYDKVDDAQSNNSKSQLEEYKEVKPYWGKAPYTALPDYVFSRLLFRIRSGSLPVAAFEGKRQQGLNTTCMVCNSGVDETVMHFVKECNGRTQGAIRHNMLQRIKGRVVDNGIPAEEATDDKLWLLALGTAVEHVFPQFFEWKDKEDSRCLSTSEFIQLSIGKVLTDKSLAKAKRLNGMVLNEARSLVQLWNNRNGALGGGPSANNNDDDALVIFNHGRGRGQAIGGRGRGVGRGRAGRGRGNANDGQMNIDQFFHNNNNIPNNNHNYNLTGDVGLNAEAMPMVGQIT